jgi:putative hydrolase of the HAD superfamily
VAIKAVVFDFGKVISFPPAETVMEELASIAGLDAKTMDALLWPPRDEYDRGTINGLEYYRTLLAGGGIVLDEPALKRMLQIDLNGWTHINPGTVQLMKDIKVAGLKLGILSNIPHDFLALARGTLPVVSLPDVNIFSCETGFIKPEPAIYEALIAALGCKPAEIVFFDDVEKNVAGAREMGINAFIWKDPETARITVKELAPCL